MPSKKVLFIIFSALFSAFAFMNLQYFLSFIGFIPVFYILPFLDKKKSLYLGFLFGFIYSLCLYFWMFNGFISYSSKAIGLAVLFLLVSCSFSGLFFSIIFVASKFTWLKNSTSQISYWVNRIAIAAIWVLGEYLFTLLLKGFPLHRYRMGFALCENIYLIQLASFGGLALLTFVVVLSNILLADFFTTINKQTLLKGLSVPLVCFIVGFISYKSYKPQHINKPFKVAVVSANTNPNTKWSQAKVDKMAKDYFYIGKEAFKKKPDFIVWPESTIPWTYEENDDLLKAILNISKNTNITNVLGLLTTANKREVYNSVFYYNKEKIVGQYHKEIPVKGTEAPFLGFLLPIASGKEFTIKEAAKNYTVNTPFGNAGTLICNESTTEQAALKQVTNNNVHFFFNISNDGWFKDYYVTEHHLYYNRLIAVEYRKDMAISNNCGYNTIIKSNGNMMQSVKKNSPTLVYETLQANTNKTLATIFPLGFIYLLTILLFTNYFIIFKFKQT